VTPPGISIVRGVRLIVFLESCFADLWRRRRCSDIA
jgi:hypothetical protein